MQEDTSCHRYHNHSLAENNHYDCKDTSKGAVTYLPGNSSDNISSTPMIT